MEQRNSTPIQALLLSMAGVDPHGSARTLRRLSIKISNLPTSVLNEHQWSDVIAPLSHSLGATVSCSSSDLYITASYY
ncbi:hypothetical protein NXS19_000803 [Fusarium pseudograminearum]|nr:hypothetical protein NXS19_000803 [Fusarium pseudograminearum]